MGFQKNLKIILRTPIDMDNSVFVLGAECYPAFSTMSGPRVMYFSKSALTAIRSASASDRLFPSSGGGGAEYKDGWPGMVISLNVPHSE